MGSTFNIHIGTTADLAAIRSVVAEANATSKATEAVNRAEAERERRLDAMRSRLNTLQRQQRSAAFDRLPAAEKISQLTARETTLQQRLNTALAQGNQQRQLALKTSLALTQAELAQLRTAQSGSAGGMFAGGIAALARRFAPGAIAAYVGFKAKQEYADIMQRASDVQDFASRLNTDAEYAQQLQFAGGKSGFEPAQIASTFKAVRLAQTAAVRGNEEMLAAFKRFDVSAADLKTKRPEEIFLQIAQNAGPAGTATASMKEQVMILGKAADVAMGAFRDGFAGAADNARAFGLVIEKDVITQLDEMGERLQAARQRASAQAAPWALAWADIKENVLKGAGMLHEATFGRIAARLGAGASGASDDEARMIADQQLAELAARNLAVRMASEGGKNGKRDTAKADEAEAAAEIGRINEEVAKAEEEARFAALSKDQQRLEMTVRVAALEREIVEAKQRGDNLTVAQKRLDAAKLTKEINEQLAREQPKAAASGAPQVDQLARVGGFRAGSGAGAIQIQEQIRLARDQVSIGRQLIREIDRMNQKIEKLTGDA